MKITFLGLMSLALYCAEPQDEAKSILLRPSRLSNTTSRIDAASRAFLGRPYIHHALGEGEHGTVDQQPLYRFDAFDCVSFLEIVLALALSKNLGQFESTLNAIRYENGKVSFESRNHFPCLQWIPHLVARGYLIETHPQVGKVAIARSTIQWSRWYAKMFPTLATDRSSQISELSYLPLEEIIDLESQKRRESNWIKIPNASIVSVVRPDWHVERAIGTRMNVSHQGFLIWKNKTLYLRHAKSEVGKKVVDEDFESYLLRASKIPSVKGIHLLSPRD